MKFSKYTPIILLSALSLVPLLNLLTPGMFIAHDSFDHVARIANFYQSLTEGNIVPRWAGNLNWGYGHPILMFLYPLPSYVASLFLGFGFSTVDSTKLVFAAAYWASIIAMYLWLRVQLGRTPAVVGATLYGFAPYRFVDLYVRGAIGEHVAFIFAPLLCLGLFLQAAGPFRLQAILITTLATAGLILSHNALSLMFLGFGFLYGLYLLFTQAKQKKIYILEAIGAVALGFMTSSFFWLPAFFEGKYTLRDIVTKGGVQDRFVPFIKFLYSPWNYGGGNDFTKEVGPVHWAVIAGSIWATLKTKKNNIRWFAVVCLGTLLVSIVLMTSTSSVVWERVALMQKFQFPWRLMSLVVFAAAILGAICMHIVPARLQKVAVFLLTAGTLFATNTMWRAKGYEVRPKLYYESVYKGTTDTGESSPIWSVRFMEHFPGALVEISEGEGTVEISRRTFEQHAFIVHALSPKTRVVDNTLYFPGWTVLVNGNQLTPYDIWFQDPDYRGLINFWLPEGKHTITVEFKETKLRKLANVVSLLGWCIVFFMVLVVFIQRVKRKTR